MIENILFTDPQAKLPGSFCVLCGGECYRPGYVCLGCERRALGCSRN